MSRISDKPYFVYVLWSASAKRFYLGIAEDPQSRLEQHSGGDLAGWTKRYRSWELVFTERHPRYTEARLRELELKAQKSGQGFFAKTGLDPSRFGRGA